MIGKNIAAVSLMLFGSVVGHSSMLFPLPRGHPLNPNSRVKDFACITTPLNGGPGCPPKPFPCGYSEADLVIGTTLKAGNQINVKFYNPNFPNGPKPGDEERDQARHTGGLCEFSLSYDLGKTFQVIATYHKSCPDIFFEWPVWIPANVPACDHCLFAWSWINHSGNREFYMNCADVKIESNISSSTPFIVTSEITKANLDEFNNEKFTPEGDGPVDTNAKGSGPSALDIEANRIGFGGKPSLVSKKTRKTETFKTENSTFGVCVEGSFICISKSEFGICNHGNFVKFDCPKGTTCIEEGKCR